MARRVRIYLFGFILGCIIVYSSLIKDRTKELLGWLPSARIITELSQNEIKKSNLTDCKLKCLNLGESFIPLIFEEGDVDFSRSRPKEKPRQYLVELKKQNELFEIYIYVMDSTTIIKDIIMPEHENSCNCPK